MEDMSQLLKAQIATHPRYPSLVSAYIDCQKVGAPPEMASLLEDISGAKHPVVAMTTQTQIGADPELDQFMESYCLVLERYKEELSKPMNEATTFLSNMESELRTLIQNNSCQSGVLVATTASAGDAGGTSEDEMSCGEVDTRESQESSSSWAGEQDLKGMLLRKYSGYLSSLRKEFLNKRKKGKLPKEARVTLLDWWNNHYRWPYPTDEEKLMLSETTGLHQKQINNWFINQRKRHWKPSEDMRFALVEGVSDAGIGGEAMYFDSRGATRDNA